MATVLRNPDRFKKAIERFYTGRCTVTVKKSVKDETTKKIRPQEVVIYEDIPCRLSHDSKALTESYDRNTATQTIKLFVDNEFDIPTGAKIKVTQDNITNLYGASSVSNVFETHREIELEKWEDWA